MLAAPGSIRAGARAQRSPLMCPAFGAQQRRSIVGELMQQSHPYVRPPSTAASWSKLRHRAKSCRLGCALFVAAVPILLLSCRQSEPARPAAAPVDVEVALVTTRDVPLVKEWIGTLDGRVNAEIRGQLTGYLLRQAYREGSFVRKGELLFEIDPRPFEAALNEARGHLEVQWPNTALARRRRQRRAAALRSAAFGAQKEDLQGLSRLDNVSKASPEVKRDRKRENTGFRVDSI